jgi:hypothetical protein
MTILAFSIGLKTPSSSRRPVYIEFAHENYLDEALLGYQYHSTIPHTQSGSNTLELRNGSIRGRPMSPLTNGLCLKP